jgi:hypothetical protein
LAGGGVETGVLEVLSAVGQPVGFGHAVN